MLSAFAKWFVVVRFSTEKCVGFPGLIAIFASVVMRESDSRFGSGWGPLPHSVELARC